MRSQTCSMDVVGPSNLFDQMIPLISKSRIEETNRQFSHLYSASGTPDYEKAADYLLKKLEEY